MTKLHLSQADAERYLSQADLKRYGLVKATPKTPTRRKSSADNDRRRSLAIQARSDAKARELHIKRLQKQADANRRAAIAQAKRESIAAQKADAARERARQRNAAARKRAISHAVKHTEVGVRRGHRNVMGFLNRIGR
jgi:hypothetical protein